jgi:hypothetical protein
MRRWPMHCVTLISFCRFLSSSQIIGDCQRHQGGIGVL